MLQDFFRKIAPIAVAAMSIGLSGCDGANVTVNGESGVPLSELDMTGDAPTEVLLAGPDTIVITDGTKLAIDVEGDAKTVAAMRFSLKDGTLAIMRAKGNWKDGGKATINITMPSPKALILAGSGTINAASLASQADVKILGSGKASTASIAADKLEVTVAGSGTYLASGVAKALDLTVAGSGSARMGGLKVETADIKIVGSGDAEFASDGTVDASIMGSGDVTITGRATCKVKSMGSGTVTCQNVTQETE